MTSWFKQSGMTPSEARAELLRQARERGGVLAPGVEGQVARCPACGQEEAVLCYLDGRSRIRIYCTSCTMGLYAGTDLAIAGIVTVFKDLCPLILRLKSPKFQALDAGVAGKEESASLATETAGGAHG